MRTETIHRLFFNFDAIHLVVLNGLARLDLLLALVY